MTRRLADRSRVPRGRPDVQHVVDADRHRRRRRCRVDRQRRAAGTSPLPQSVSRFDPESSAPIATISLRRPPGGHLRCSSAAGGRRLAVSPEAVWVIDGRISTPVAHRSALEQERRRIAAWRRTTSQRARETSGSRTAVGLAEIDTGANTVGATCRSHGRSSGPLAVGGGAVWVTDLENGSCCASTRTRG